MVLLDFSMSPLGKGESVAPYVARCLEIIAASEPRYVTEQLTLAVASEPDGSGERIALLHSGDRVELLEEQQEHARIRLESGREGWVTASYLSAGPPLRQQLAARAQEL